MPKYEFVAVDFDGTLCADAFPEVGAPNRAVIDYVKRLAADGSKIILYTSRENGTRKLLDEAVAFCKAQEIPRYAVNENPGNPHAANERWQELMKIAEQCGFIIQAAGTAFLATNRVQAAEMGATRYADIQRMNGRCPQEIGLPGCLDSFTGKPGCVGDRCELWKRRKDHADT